MSLARFFPLRATSLAVVVAFCSPIVHAADAPAAAASEPVRVVTDVAHWQHPVKAVFAHYKLTLQRVTLVGRHATFDVAFPFDPMTGPNEATLYALCADLMRANGNWDYTLQSQEDRVAIDATWERARRTISLAYRRL